MWKTEGRLGLGGVGTEVVSLRSRWGLSNMSRIFSSSKWANLWPQELCTSSSFPMGDGGEMASSNLHIWGLSWLSGLGSNVTSLVSFSNHLSCR